MVPDAMDGPVDEWMADVIVDCRVRRARALAAAVAVLQADDDDAAACQAAVSAIETLPRGVLVALLAATLGEAARHLVDEIPDPVELQAHLDKVLLRCMAGE